MGKGRPGAEEVAAASWIAVYDVKDKNLVSLLRAALDEGEAEAIVLAREERVPVVLLDEKDARQVARRLHLQALGVVGLLIWAKQIGAIASLQEQLDRLQERGKFRLSQSVYVAALQTVGEMKPS